MPFGNVMVSVLTRPKQSRDAIGTDQAAQSRERMDSLVLGPLGGPKFSAAMETADSDCSRGTGARYLSEA